TERPTGSEKRNDLPPLDGFRAKKPHAAPISTHAPCGLAGRHWRTQQLHQLFRRSLRLLAEFGRKPGGQLEIVLGVPIFRRSFNGPPKLSPGSRHPAKPRAALLSPPRFLEEGTTRPQVRRSGVRRALGFVDRLVVSTEAVQHPQLVGDDMIVICGEELLA